MKHTAETKARISQTKLGHTTSPEARAKMSESAKLRKASPQTRERIAAALRGSGMQVRAKGYRDLRQLGHPYAVDGYVREHRLVVERVIGRYLMPWEVVHHDDGNKLNNAAYNLILFASAAAHTRHHNSLVDPIWLNTTRAIAKRWTTRKENYV